METRTFTRKNNEWPYREVEVILHKCWFIVHAKSRTRISDNQLPYPTEAACKKGCRQVVQNNPKDIREQYYPEGVDAAPFWCHENGYPHSAVETIPTFVQIKKDKKGNYVWSLYRVREPFMKLSQGNKDLEAVKAEALSFFPEARIELLS